MVEPFRADIAELADLDALARFVAERHGRLDVVFANAGGGRPGLFDQVSEDDFDFTVGTNLKGTYFTVQKLAPLMTDGGSVILNTSILGVQGRAGFSVYAATKAAIRSLARSLTAELSAKHIRVNALAPGQIDTDLMRKVGMPDEMIDQVRAQAAAQIPMARTGSAEEVAKAVLFLSTDESSYITGVELTVDGGWSQV